MPAVIDQVHVIDARRAGRHAAEARQATIDVLDLRRRGRAIALQHRLDEVDAPARAVALVAQQHVGRAGRGAEAAMHALAQDVLAARGLGIVELGQREVGLHRQPIRPGLKRPLGSKLSFTREASAASAVGCGWNTGTLDLAFSLARIRVAWPPVEPSAPRTIEWSASSLGGIASQTSPPDQS